MAKSVEGLFFFVLCLFSTLFVSPCLGDIGTAGPWDISNSARLPNKANACGYLELPRDVIFAAAGDGLWDNGAACKREYLVKFVNCKSCQIYKVLIVDHVSIEGTLMAFPESFMKEILKDYDGPMLMIVDYELYSTSCEGKSGSNFQSKNSSNTLP